VTAGLHGREHRIRRIGRHAAPTGTRKALRRAGLAVPALAAAGALAVVPQVRHLVTGGSGTAQAADQLTADRMGAGVAMRAARSETRWLHSAQVTRKPPRPASSPGPAVHPAVHPAVAPVAATPIASAGSAASGSSSVTCSASASGLLPDNYAAIVTFLTGHGYSGNAAAGIAGNIYQESKGDPESAGDGGGGLIGWTPLPAGLVTGSPSADLQAQLEAILAFNQQWAQYLPALNGASSPAAAADVYVTDFERAGIPAAGTREAAAQAVATACGI
jgi:hypothetical protein